MGVWTSEFRTPLPPNPQNAHEVSKSTTNYDAPTGGLLEMLTRKQYELLRFINERLKEAGVPPSFDEMKDALDLRSKSGIHRLITALEERGFIRRLPNRARAIEVIKLPELAGGGNGKAAAASPRASSKARSARSAPQCGRRGRWQPSGRRAGDGPDRRRHADRGAADPQPHHQRAARHARLRRALRAEVRGNSMVDAGILDGDMALIQRNETADTGDIVVALIDEEEATLKRFRRRAPRSRWSPPTPPTKSASCRRTGSGFRAS